MTVSYKGKYTLKHPEKYIGDKDGITYRSGLELKFFNWCERDSNVLRWSSEPFPVPYRLIMENEDGQKYNKAHRYFFDALLKVRERSGKVSIWMVEIKPYKQTSAPKMPKRKTKYYLRECVEWKRNQAKWAAADKYCQKKGWEFKIITEKQILGYVYNS